MASRRMICAGRGEKHVPWLPRACLPWPFAVPVAMAVVSSAVPAIPRSAPSSPKSHLLRPRWDFGRMISDNKRIEYCCHVTYAARTVAGMLDHITLHVRDVGRSIAFYEHALAPLGYIVKAHHEPTLGFGVDDGTPHSDFYVPRWMMPRSRRRPRISRSSPRTVRPCGVSMPRRSPSAAETTALRDRARIIRGTIPHSCWIRTAITSRPSSTGRDGSKTIADRRCERLLYDCTTASG